MKRLCAVAMALVMTSGLCMGAVKWTHDYDKALEQAKQEKKLLMVDVYTDWCGWCKKLDRDVYSNKAVEERLGKDFIAVKVNAEKDAKGPSLARKFGTHGYPHIVFVKADGAKIYEIGGYQPVDDFLKSLDEAVKKAK